MTIYIVATPQNKLDKKNRPSGWRFVPLDRRNGGVEKWREQLQLLTAGKEITNVIASDLDGESARIAGDELHLPVHTDYIYRRFNVGRYHARDADAVDGALRAIQKDWESNVDKPIREGDSLTSYRKRFVRAFETMLDKEGTVLFVTDPRSIGMIRASFDPRALVMNGNPVRLDRIYKVSRGLPS